MKNKINLIVAALLLTFSSVAIAQESTSKDGDRAKKFATLKAEMLANINKEKSILDQAASCINAAQNIEAMKKCHDAKKSESQKLQAEMQQNRLQNLNERKQNLTDRLNKIEAKQGEAGTKK